MLFMLIVVLLSTKMSFCDHCLKSCMRDHTKQTDGPRDILIERPQDRQTDHTTGMMRDTRQVASQTTSHTRDRPDDTTG